MADKSPRAPGTTPAPPPAPVAEPAPPANWGAIVETLRNEQNRARQIDKLLDAAEQINRAQNIIREVEERKTAVQAEIAELERLAETARKDTEEAQAIHKATVKRLTEGAEMRQKALQEGLDRDALKAKQALEALRAEYQQAQAAAKERIEALADQETTLTARVADAQKRLTVVRSQLAEMARMAG